MTSHHHRGHGLPGSIYGGAAPGAVFAGGAGRLMSGAKIYGSGVLHGEHLIPEHELHSAAMHYKTLHNLHRRGERPHPIIPTDHAIRLMHEHLHGAHGPHGGFLPPAVLAAALPFVSQAASSLLGGFFNKGGGHIADLLRGHGMHPHIGLPRRVNLNGHHHWHLHGEGFKDLLRSAFQKAKEVWHSEPVKRFGRSAFDTLTQALISALTNRAQSFGEKLFKGPTAAADAMEPTTTGGMNEAATNYAEAAGTPPQDLAEPEAVAGAGLRRRRTTKRAAPMKRKRAAPRRSHHHHHGHLLPSIY